jgi:hypothetical protein
MPVRALEMVAAGDTSLEEAKRIVFLDPAHAEPAMVAQETHLRLAS